jgi:hypothetical protein
MEEQNLNEPQNPAFLVGAVMGSASRIPESFTGFSESVMSNFDYDIDEKVAEAIKDKPLYAQYSSWNFCGYVWWQNGKWCCEVWTYGSWNETFVADTLSEIMSDVSSEYGSD